MQFKDLTKRVKAGHVTFAKGPEDGMVTVTEARFDPLSGESVPPDTSNATVEQMELGRAQVESHYDEQLAKVAAAKATDLAEFDTIIKEFKKVLK